MTQQEGQAQQPGSVVWVDGYQTSLGREQFPRRRGARIRSVGQEGMSVLIGGFKSSVFVPFEMAHTSMHPPASLIRLDSSDSRVRLFERLRLFHRASRVG